MCFIDQCPDPPRDGCLFCERHMKLYCSDHTSHPSVLTDTTGPCGSCGKTEWECQCDSVNSDEPVRPLAEDKE